MASASIVAAKAILVMVDNVRHVSPEIGVVADPLEDDLPGAKGTAVSSA